MSAGEESSVNEFRSHACYPEIFIHPTIAEALALSDDRFETYIRHGCKLPIEKAPLRAQLRAMRDELRFYRALRCL